MAHKKGLRSLAVGFMPAKADTKIQNAFLENTLTPLIKQAKNGLITLFFMDASHFVMGGFAGRVWSVVRRFVKTSSGRKRYNVLGALNFISKKMETVCNDTYITATQVVELLEKISANYTINPIKIVLDNARYQRCKMVIERAADLGIELVFLPTYSPNLNLIERIWKLVKSKVLNSAYFDTFKVFSDNIKDCVDTLHLNSLGDMDKLITANFNIINESLVIC